MAKIIFLMKITVIIPTYRRPESLKQCLRGLAKQARLADEVLLIVRGGDKATRNFLKTLDRQKLSLRVSTVAVRGIASARNVGLDEAKGDIIVFIDDDAVPRTDWLARLEKYYLADPKIGGVGGRDFIYQNGKLQKGAKKIVGKIQWWGRTVGNHHLGVGKPREVDILKGVNMSYRKEAIADIRFDRRLLGSSVHPGHEIDFCCYIKSKGYKLIYDPEVSVDHYIAERIDEEYKRNKLSFKAVKNEANNYTLIMLRHLSCPRRLAFMLWCVFVGTRSSPGFIQLLRFLPGQKTLAIKKLLAAYRGRWRGWCAFKRYSKGAEKK